MKHRLLYAGFVVAALSLAGSFGAAHATIVGSTPNTNFADSSVTFSLGDATFTFINDPSQTYPLSVQTSGSGMVTLLGGSIPNSPHQPDGVGGAGQHLPTYSNIFGQTAYVYDSFPTATPAPSFNFFGPYIGLEFMLNGQVHYGYAEIDNLNTLTSYAYNSVAGGGIVTGAAIQAAPPTAVPEPSSLGMFGLGLFLIGIGACWLRRRQSHWIAPPSAA